MNHPIAFGRACRYDEARAPVHQFRVVFWRKEPDGHQSSWIDDDFPDRKSAKARAEAIAEQGHRAAVYNFRGDAVHVAYEPDTPAGRAPLQVTRLARVANPTASKPGSYGRK